MDRGERRRVEPVATTNPAKTSEPAEKGEPEALSLPPSGSSPIADLKHYNFALCTGVSSPVLPAATGNRQLRCFTVSPGLTLRRREVADIIEAARQYSGRPVISIEPPNESDYAPAGAIQVVILVSGACNGGCSDRLWLRRGKRGWRVLKRIGGECWATFARPAAHKAVADDKGRSALGLRSTGRGRAPRC
jgi:hypothetical protein